MKRRKKKKVKTLTKSGDVVVITMRQLQAWLAALVLSGSAAARVQHLNILEHLDELKDTYDYVIAGGGTAGLTVADRLSADGKCKSLTQISAKTEKLTDLRSLDTVLVVEHGILGMSR